MKSLSPRCSELAALRADEGGLPLSGSRQLQRHIERIPGPIPDIWVPLMGQVGSFFNQLPRIVMYSHRGESLAGQRGSLRRTDGPAEPSGQLHTGEYREAPLTATRPPAVSKGLTSHQRFSLSNESRIVALSDVW